MSKIEEAMKLIGPGCACEVNLGNILVLTGALKEAIEQHEAFRQEVSDAVEVANMRVKELKRNTSYIVNHMQQYIIAKPDPLVIEAREICARVCEGWIDIPKDRAAAYRAGAHDDEADFAYVYAALAKRGLEIREKSK